MTTRYVEPMPPAPTVSAGNTAVFDIPPTYTFDKLHFAYAESGTPANQATLEAGIDEVRVSVNRKVQRRMNADELLAMNATYGAAFQTGTMPIFFAEPWLRSELGEDLLSWGMADVESFQVEVDINSGATSPTLSLHAIKRRIEKAMGPIVKVKKFNVPVTATGDRTVSNLDKLDTYLAFHMTTANISNLRCVRDGDDVINAAPGILDDLYEDQGLVPQSAWTQWICNSDRRWSGGLEMVRPDPRAPNDRNRDIRVQDLRLVTTMSSASTYDLITETLGPRE